MAVQFENISPRQRVVAIASLVGNGEEQMRAASELAVFGRPAVYQAGDWIFRDAVENESAVFVIDGRVSVEYHRTGLVADFSGPSAVGTIHRFARVPERVSVRALEESHVLLVPYLRLIQALARYSSIMVTLCAELAGQLKDELGAIAPAWGGARSTTFAAPSGGRLDDAYDGYLALRRTGLFTPGSADALLALANGGVVSEYEPGQNIWEEGDRSDSFHLVVEGQLRASTSAPAPDATVGSWQLVGLVDAFLRREPASFSLIAEEPTKVLSFKVARSRAILEDSPALAMDILAALSRAKLGLPYRVDDAMTQLEG